MAFAPVITRFYGPEAYGLQGIFMSVLGLLMTIAALGYPTAIVMPKCDSEALGVLKLSVLVSFGVAAVISFCLLLFGENFLSALNAQKISSYIYLLPLAMMMAVVGDALYQWLIRKKAFYVSAKYGAINTLGIGTFKSISGVFYPSAVVLIVANSVSRLTVSLLPYLVWRRSEKEAAAKECLEQRTKLSELAKRYKDFPLLRTPQNLINAFSQSLPVLLLSGYFGASAAGQYSIAMAVLVMPANLIGKSVMSVFYPRINEAINNGENPRSLIIKATKGLAISGLWPFLIVVLAGPLMFEFVFGAEWRTGGVYAQLLSLWVFFQFINKPAVAAIPALRLQGGLLIYELFSTGSKVIALWAGYSLLHSHVAAVALFSMVGVVAYAWLILWVIKCAKDVPAHIERTHEGN